mgnify:CR=1 FL=1
MNICKNCGIQIESHKKYCSLKCRNIYVNKNIRNYNKLSKFYSENFKEKYDTNPKKCILCGKIIEYNKRKNKFCSSSCAAKNTNKNRIGEKRNFSKESLKNIINANIKRYNSLEYYENPNHCIQCDNTLSFAKRKNKFCDIKCKQIYDRKNLNEYQIYYKKCQFKFSLSDYPYEFNFKLVEKYGWYQAKNHGNNLSGISRDHMISIKFGFENKINPDIISHPANCQLMIHNKNVSKYKKCSITLEELLIKINEWNNKYPPLT